MQGIDQSILERRELSLKPYTERNRKFRKGILAKVVEAQKNMHNAIEMRKYETLARASQTHLSAQSIQINLGRFKDCL
jgi:hypothetical protein